METIRPTQFLRDDHKRINGLFRQLEAVDQRASEMKDGVVRELFMELEIHASVEDEVLFPSILDKLNDEERGYVTQDRELHESIDKLIRLVRKAKNVFKDPDKMNAAIDELREVLQPHFSDEEKFFPRIDRLLGDNWADLSERMKSKRDELKRRHQYDNARPDTAQNPHGGEQMRKKSA